LVRSKFSDTAWSTTWAKAGAFANTSPPNQSAAIIADEELMHQAAEFSGHAGKIPLLFIP